MSESTEKDKYYNDPRMACKYGVNCYQKNPQHLQAYKHPPAKTPPTLQHIQQGPEHPRKRFKIEPEPQKIPKEDPEQDQNKQSKIDEVTPKSLISTPKIISNPQEFIKKHFLVTMPEDFYQFWTLCQTLHTKNPLEAFKDVGLYLAGPYDVLAGKFCEVQLSQEDFLVHWRYFCDPPECQTVLRTNDRKTGLHFGYFRDNPQDLPVCLVQNSSEVDGTFEVCGDNIFAAVYDYLEGLKKNGDPFKRMHVARLQGHLKRAMEDSKLERGTKSSKITERNKKIVARSFSKLGIVVPYNRRTQLGYRELSISNRELQKLLSDIQAALPEQKSALLSKLQDILTNCNIATDECDFGTGLELGLDILAHGVDSLNHTISTLLSTNYRLLNRQEFARIAEAHMNRRRKGIDLSVV